MKLISEAGYDDLLFRPLGWTWAGDAAPPASAAAGDDYRDTFNDTSEALGALRIGRTVTGTLESSGDRDVFAVKLVAGKSYVFDLVGVAETVDPYLILRDAKGALADDDDDGGEGLNSRIVFNAEASGTYYLDARDYGDATGAYTLAARELIADDYRDTFKDGTEALGRLDLDINGAAGRLEVGRDRDIFAMEVLRGWSYFFRLESANNGGIDDPSMRVLAADGREIARNDNAESWTRDSAITFTARESGTIYVEAASAVRTDTGGYRIRAGGRGPADDFSDTLDDARSPVGALTLAEPSVLGWIEKRGDRDLFAVEVQEGGRYTFDVTGYDYSALDASVRLVDAQGNTLAAGVDLNGGSDARVSYEAGANATVYVEVSGAARSRGLYTVAMTAANEPAPSAFDIDLRYTGDERFRAAFEEAEARWEAIITADIPDVNTSRYGLIDDLRIDASVIEIDGPGNILGQAGPDLIRPGSFLPAHGIMEFDSADVEGLLSSGAFLGVVLHEMGHVLGLGTIWEDKGLKATGSFSYTGAHALAEYRTLAGNTALNAIPLETTGGGGTAGAHWAENVFGDELMTGYANGGLPLSRMTIGGMRDLGYQVDYAEADPYVLPAMRPAAADALLTDPYAVLGTL